MSALVNHKSMKCHIRWIQDAQEQVSGCMALMTTECLVIWQVAGHLKRDPNRGVKPLSCESWVRTILFSDISCEGPWGWREPEQSVDTRSKWRKEKCFPVFCQWQILEIRQFKGNGCSSSWFWRLLSVGPWHHWLTQNIITQSVEGQRWSQWPRSNDREEANVPASSVTWLPSGRSPPLKICVLSVVTQAGNETCISHPLSQTTKWSYELLLSD